MGDNNYRSAGSMHVCGPTNHFEDVNTLLSIVGGYKRLGGKVPPQVEAMLELARAGKNVEESMNAACDGLFKFYLSENLRCAREAGYSNLDQYQAERSSDPHGTRVIQHEDCVIRVERRWQLTNIDYAMNLQNPDSALRQFLRRTAEQVEQIVSKYIKRSAIKKIKSDSSVPVSTP